MKSTPKQPKDSSARWESVAWGSVALIVLNVILGPMLVGVNKRAAVIICFGSLSVVAALQLWRSVSTRRAGAGALGSVEWTKEPVLYVAKLTMNALLLLGSVSAFVYGLFAM
jgi:hypothetical protein